MNTENILKIKNKLKEDYNFIKNDGNILTNIAKDLLTENDNDYQKTLEFLETLSKQNIQDRMWEMMQDLETAGEISYLIKENYKKDKIKLDNLKLEIKKITNTICELENKKLELSDIKLTYDKFYSTGYDNEFEYDKCEYISKNPVIHLDVDKILTDLDMKKCNIYNITKDMLLSCNKYKEQIKIKLNYPIDISLQNNEKIIKVYIIKDVNYNTYNNEINIGKRNNIYSDKIPDTLYSKINIIYLSNYGRLIKSNDLLLSNEIKKLVCSFPGGGRSSSDVKYIKSNTYIIYNKLLSILNDDFIQINESISTREYIGITINKVNDSINTILPKLNFRMPRIFLDVIDAFHTQNTDLMQECCKKYLCITRKLTFEEAFDKIECETKLIDKQLIIDEKNKQLEEQNLTINLYIKQLEDNNKCILDKETIIIEKDNVIETMNERIEEQNSEIEKMKLEIAKLKSALTVFTS
jgi:hypothetical protein